MAPRLDLGLQRLLHPSLARESSGRLRGQVSSSIFVTLVCRQLLGSCHFARPQSESVFVFDCLRLSPSSPVSVFVSLRLRPSPSSSVSVVVSGGWSRGCRLLVRCSTSRVWKPPWRACFKFVRYSVKCGELVVKRPLLRCNVFPILTSKGFGRVFPHIKFNHLCWGFDGSVVALNCLQVG